MLFPIHSHLLYDCAYSSRKSPLSLSMNALRDLNIGGVLVPLAVGPHRSNDGFVLPRPDGLYRRRHRAVLLLDLHQLREKAACLNFLSVSFLPEFDGLQVSDHLLNETIPVNTTNIQCASGSPLAN
jgi:hypothetical protein